jgi:lipopolysaccharide biosynthesis glycosyltransferase
MDKIVIYIGYEPSQHLAYEVLKFSLESNSSAKLDIHPLHLERLKRGIDFNRPHDPLQSTEFTYTRFLVPYLTGYRGRALYMDCDMICFGDIAEIYSLDLSNFSLRVVKQSQIVAGPTKMDGRVQSSYPRKNWSSLMLMNCEELTCWTKEAVEQQSGKWLHRFEAIPDDKIGELPFEWNVLDHCDEHTKLIHYTQGGPWLKGCEDHPYANIWIEYLARFRTTQIKDLKPGLVETF